MGLTILVIALTAGITFCAGFVVGHTVGENNRS